MEVEILEEKENPLLKRKEIRFRVFHYGNPTPSRKEVREKLIAMLNADKNTFVLDRLVSSFGREVSDGFGKVYESTEAMLSIEQEHVLRKNFSEEELAQLKGEPIAKEA